MGERAAKSVDKFDLHRCRAWTMPDDCRLDLGRISPLGAVHFLITLVPLHTNLLLMRRCP